MTNAAAHINAQYGELIGRTIVAVRPLNKKELDTIGWDSFGSQVPFLLQLDNGNVIIPSADPEGNMNGYLYIEEGNFADQF